LQERGLEQQPTLNMAVSLSHIGLFALSSTVVLADHLTGTYPPPFDLSSESSLVAATWQNLSDAFDAYLSDGSTEGIIAEALSEAGADNLTFSLGLWSLHDPAAKELQYHYASPETANNPNGTNEPDADSIYKVASVTKLMTVMSGLLSLSHEQWNTPLSEIYPLLGELDSSDEVQSIQWDQVTPWALAQQIAGINSNAVPEIQYVTPDAISALVGSGYPPQSIESLGPCWKLLAQNEICSIDQWIEEISTSLPVFTPYSSPQYSNAGFTTLGAALVNLTGQSIGDLWQNNVLGPLGMNSSGFATPTGEDLDRSVVSGPIEVWSLPSGILGASGGLHSTLNDLNKFGIGILNSTLMPANETREWMKPQSLTGSLSYAMGAPWEIIRYSHPTTGKTTDVYTKLGDSGAYGGAMAIIPEYGAGFNFLNGASNATIRSAAAFAILDIMLETVVPALDAQAAAEATANFVGTYRSTDPELNSSLVIAFNESTLPGITGGLSIASFISNGSVMFTPEALPRLLPTILPFGKDGLASSGKMAFRQTEVPSYPTYTAGGGGAWSSFYGDWVLGANSPEWFRVPTNLYVFEVDEIGRAVSVSPEAFRVTLERVEDE
jgi:CubicO group peptidase (beta-lactamase class C family)